MNQKVANIYRIWISQIVTISKLFIKEIIPSKNKKKLLSETWSTSFYFKVNSQYFRITQIIYNAVPMYAYVTYITLPSATDTM